MFSVAYGKWHHWILIGAIGGAACAMILTNHNESLSTSRSMSQREFEELLLRPPLVDRQGHLRPWISAIVVHPPRAGSDSFDGLATQSISFDAYQVQDEEKNTFRLFSFDLIAKIPYEPKPVNDAGVGQGVSYPGVTLLKAEAGDTLDSIMRREYGSISMQRRAAIIGANDLLRRATNAAEIQIQPDRIYYIPPDPATNPTIVGFLNEATKWAAVQIQQPRVPIAFRYNWWEFPKYAWPMSIVGALGVFGLIVPAIVYLLRGRPSLSVEESLSRRNHRAREKTPPSDKMRPQDAEQLKKALSSLSASSESGNDGLKVACTKQQSTGASHEPPQLMGVDESVEISTSPAKPNSYRGEFYPVVAPVKIPDQSSDGADVGAK